MFYKEEAFTFHLERNQQNVWLSRKNIMLTQENLINNIHWRNYFTCEKCHKIRFSFKKTNTDPGEAVRVGSIENSSRMGVYCCEHLPAAYEMKEAKSFKPATSSLYASALDSSLLRLALLLWTRLLDDLDRPGLSRVAAALLNLWAESLRLRWAWAFLSLARSCETAAEMNREKKFYSDEQ